MSKTFLTLLSGACIAFMPVAAMAQAEAQSQGDDALVTTTQILSFQNTLTDLNRIKPLQNPRNELSEDMLDRDILDQKNKTVGKLDDLFINDEGKIAALFVHFDRLRLSDAVYMDPDVLDIKVMDDAFRLGFNEEQIEDLHAELLAETVAAAGDVDEDVLSLTDMLGEQVTTSPKGLRIGEVEDVLFDRKARVVRGVYLNINYKTIRDFGIAVPFNVLTFEQEAGDLKVTVADDYADVILEYAEERE